MTALLAFLLLLLFFLALIILLIYWRNFLVSGRKKTDTELEEKNRALIASARLNKIILESLDFHDVVQKIADTIPHELYFGTGVVAIVDQSRGVIRRLAASQTKEAIEAIKALKVPFTQIEIPMNDEHNLMAKSLREKRGFVTEDSYDVLGPVLTKEESRMIQNIMGIKTTFIYPLYGSKGRALGVFLASTKKRKEELSEYEHEMIQNFVNGVGIAIEHALLYSELANKNKEIEVANERLKALDKLKDEFLSLATHELRTPMTAIKSYLWMILNRGQTLDAAKKKLYMDRVYHSTERLLSLVNELLNVSRIESGRLALTPLVFDPISLAHEVTDEFSAKVGERRQTLTVQDSVIPQVYADKDKIHEVLLNLIGNAIKYTPEGGKITVSFREKDSMVEVAVADTGRGIAKEDMGKLFTKFGRLDNTLVAIGETGGSGLGLYLSKQLVELSGGKIWVESPARNASQPASQAKRGGQGASVAGGEVGRGSTFFFTLPIQP